MTQTQTQIPSNQSLLDQEPILHDIKDLVEQGESNVYIAKYVTKVFDIPVKKDSIRRFRKRHKLSVPTRDKAGCKINGDEATVTTAPRPYPHMDDPDKMLEERGLSPEDWIIKGATINEWDGPQAEGSVITYHQAKLNLERKRPELQIVPARADGWKAPKRQPQQSGSSKLIVVTGDQQAPFHDERLHELFCIWLEENEPDQLVALGDKVDFPDISRHRLDPENTATVNECIQVGYNIFRDYRTAAPNTEMDFMPGNHDERIRNILLDKPSVQPLYGVKQADTDEGEGSAVLTLPHLLRLDELGINYHDPLGAYDLAQINLSDKLAVRHGWIARQGSGVSALATLEHLGYSVIVGHTHRQSIVYKTTHDIDGQPTTLTAAEAGCMCRINQQTISGRKWPNFTVMPDWVQGFSTVTVHDDGTFKIDNATYVTHKGKGTLLWRDQQFKG